MLISHYPAMGQTLNINLDEYFNNLHRAAQEKNIVKFEHVVNQGILLARKTSNRELADSIFSLSGDFHLMEGKEEDALMDYLVSHTIRSKMDDARAKVEMAIKISHFLEEWELYVKASHYSIYAYEIAEKSLPEQLQLNIGKRIVRLQYQANLLQSGIRNGRDLLAAYKKVNNSEGIIYAINLLAAMSLESGEVTKALEYTIEKINIISDNRDSIDLVEAYLSASELCLKSHDLNGSLEHLRRAEKIIDKHHNYSLKAAVLYHFASHYSRSKEFNLTISYSLKALELFASQNIADTTLKRNIYNTLVQAYISLSQYKEGHKINDHILLSSLKDSIWLSQYYRTRANLFQQSNDHKNAMIHYRNYRNIEDDLNQKSYQKRLELKDKRIDVEKYEKQVANTIYLKELDSEKQDSASFKRKSESAERSRNLILGLLGGSLIVLLLFYRIYRIRKKGAERLKEQKSKLEVTLLKLKNTQQQLVQQERMASLGQLTAGIAHEINNPLNFLSGNTQALKMDLQDIRAYLDKVILLQEQAKDPKSLYDFMNKSGAKEVKLALTEIGELIEGIEKGSDRIKDIVKSLQIFTYQANSPKKMEDLKSLIHSAAVILKGKIKEKDIHLIMDIENLPRVRVHAGKLTQVFLNILDNAIAASSQGGQIEITHQKESENAILIFKDNGIGMNQKTAIKIFEPFFTTKEIGKGTGLGMSISYGIIKEHDGNILIESELSKGTVIQVILPI